MDDPVHIAAVMVVWTEVTMETMVFQRGGNVQRERRGHMRLLVTRRCALGQRQATQPRPESARVGM